MDNQKKLELTLCGMLPYGLKCSFSTDEIYTLIGIVNKDLWLKELTYLADSFLCKPHLHSLDKLTEPILDGGLIPMDEFRKLVPFTDLNDELAKCIIGMFKEEFVIVPFWIIEKLKEWHFNIYDLPKEMYIEKSESNGK